MKQPTPQIGGKADPLNQRPDAERELFKQFSQLCNGFPNEAAIGASANILINALRQNKVTWREAEPAFDELFGKLKSILASHYDGTGRRRSVFPHPQVLNVPLIDMRKKR